MRNHKKLFWIYLGAVSFIAMGFADFPLIAYHLQKSGIMTQHWIPLSYAIAMFVEAMAVLPMGWLFDRFGIKTMVGTTLLSALAVPLAFLGSDLTIFIAMGFWGIGMGAQASIVRAEIAVLTDASKRGTAYGIFNFVYGLSWFLGSVLLGYLYDQSILALVVCAVAFHILALAMLGVLLFHGRQQQLKG